MSKNINVTRSSMPGYEEYCEEIKALWDSRWLTNMGAKHRQLEADLKNYLHTPNVTLFANGHLALENVLAAFDFPKGGEVITTPLPSPPLPMPLSAAAYSRCSAMSIPWTTPWM